MGKYQELAKNIPWESFGRETVASQLAHSLLPIGFLPYQPVLYSEHDANLFIADPNIEKYIMQIVGTAIQAAEAKIVTCQHVIDEIKQQQIQGYLLCRTFRGNTVRYQPYRLIGAASYLDPRTNQLNPSVDLAALILPIVRTEAHPYEVPNVKWGDSSQLGIGDPVIVGGYPYGTEMFLYTQSNRGLIQPTFYSGIVSALIPVMAQHETRLIQVSIPAAGGMSGGAVFLPETGEVVGMMTGCVHHNDIPLPISYALPSEIIVPFVEAITFETKD